MQQEESPPAADAGPDTREPANGAPLPPPPPPPSSSSDPALEPAPTEGARTEPDGGGPGGGATEGDRVAGSPGGPRVSDAATRHESVDPDGSEATAGTGDAGGTPGAPLQGGRGERGWRPPAATQGVSILWDEIEGMKTQIDKLMDLVATILDDNKKLKQEVQELRNSQHGAQQKSSWQPQLPTGTAPSKDFSVQIRVTGKTGGAENKFLNDTKKLVSSQSISLKAKKFTETSKDPLLIFCPIASRMGTDIKNALEGISSLQKVLLVVMHYVRKDITEISIDPKQQVPHPALVQAVHIRYTLQDGFYPCEMNQRAMADMANAIKKLAEDN